MTHKNTNRYIDALPFLVHTYNNRKHRMIGISPAEANLPGRAYHIRRKKELHYSKIKRKKPKYKIGQTVRISIMKGKFDKGFAPQFKEEIFRIKSISTRLPKPTYELKTLEQDETLEVNFLKMNLRPWMSRNYLSLKRFYGQKKIKKRGKKWFW